MFLNGITNMTSGQSEEKENKMVNFTTNIPELDLENKKLFQASSILEKLGNHPGVSVQEFYVAMVLEEQISTEEHESLTLAAISIETMMALESVHDEHENPTVH